MPTTTQSTAVDRSYKASARQPEIVTIAPIQFMMIDGHGDPNTSTEYQQALQALYSVSYALKFAVKKSGGEDYHVRPLEGLWWSDNLADFTADRKADWNWTMMIAQPDVVTRERYEQVSAEVMGKKHPVGLARARFESFEEGVCAQIMHVGPFTAEGPTIARLHEFIRAQGYRFDDPSLKHHEIYLTDITKAAPEKWRTIVRQPMRPTL